MPTQDDVRRLALALPEVTEHDDRFAFLVRGKQFAWVLLERVAPRKSRVPVPDALAVRVASVADQQHLVAADPDAFFVTDHYRGYRAVLVRLPAVAPDELAELLADAWRTQAPAALVRAYDGAG